MICRLFCLSAPVRPLSRWRPAAALALAAPAALRAGRRQAGAARPPKPPRIKKALEQKFPGARSRAASTKTPYFGLYEVQFDDRIVYTDAKVEVPPRRLGLRHRVEDQPDRGAAAQAEPRRRREPAARPRDQEGQGQRRAQAHRVLRRRLPVLRQAREGTEDRRQRHDLHVPVPDRPAASGCGAQVAG